MGRVNIKGSGIYMSVSVSALSDHLMGPGSNGKTIDSQRQVSVSALSDHLMGLQSHLSEMSRLDRFSIRSFGSFDGTLWLVRRLV